MGVCAFKFPTTTQVRFQFPSLPSTKDECVETNLPPSPSPHGHLYNFEFRADHANEKGVSSRQDIRKYVLM